jgi:hypothetical protein
MNYVITEIKLFKIIIVNVYIFKIYQNYFL